MSNKYNFTLDMETDNSNALILRNIRAETDVLEVACAHGRMTKYLHEQLQCRVAIIEWDQEAASSAARYAVDARHVGNKFGDLEQSFWYDTFRREKKVFDYIVLADVLEHLRDPWKVLKQIAELIKPDGSIWISVPNIAHNGVLIELLNDRFDYREIGLLDNTHLRFFTAGTLEQMAVGAGLRVTQRLDPLLPVPNTELKNSYDDVPWYVARYLRRRPGGEIYQFVWELKLAPSPHVAAP